MKNKIFKCLNCLDINLCKKCEERHMDQQSINREVLMMLTHLTEEIESIVSIVESLNTDTSRFQYLQEQLEKVRVAVTDPASRRYL